MYSAQRVVHRKENVDVKLDRSGSGRSIKCTPRTKGVGAKGDIARVILALKEENPGGSQVARVVGVFFL